MLIINELYKIAVVAIFLMATNTAHAQPDWAVNPPDFQYTMTVTGVGLFQCDESLDEGDMIAAFIDGQCQGVQSFGTLHESRQYAFLTIYDNTPTGSTIDFKLYDSSEDKVIDVVFPLSFEENGIMGSLATPYEFQTDYKLTEVLLSNQMISSEDIAGTIIGEVLAVNEIGDTMAYQIDFVMDGAGVDNDSFTVQDNQLILDVAPDFANKTSYQVHLMVISPAGCTQDAVFEITVSNDNVAPTGLDKSDTSIAENEVEGSLVTPLLAIDETDGDTHQFTLIGSGEEWPDNAFFQISGTELQSAVIFDYEVRNEYLLQIKITDRVGNVYVDTLAIDILDVIEFEDLKTGNVITPNEDGLNDFFEIPNVDLFANYELCIYNDNGNRVYRKERYQNTWDGRNKNGARLPNGTYYFTLREKDNEQNAFKGSIHLYRTNNY